MPAGLLEQLGLVGPGHPSRVTQPGAMLPIETPFVSQPTPVAQGQMRSINTELPRAIPPGVLELMSELPGRERADEMLRLRNWQRSSSNRFMAFLFAGSLLREGPRGGDLDVPEPHLSIARLLLLDTLKENPGLMKEMLPKTGT